MNYNIENILAKEILDPKDIIALLNTEGKEKLLLFEKAIDIKNKYIGNKVYFRGLIEFSNICIKDCLYCGIRKSNTKVNHYTLSDKDIVAASKFAYENNYGSIVLQAGEISSSKFVDRITNLIYEIKSISKNTLGITLSLGEQTKDTYKKWFDAGAHRYLLRIESSNSELYNKIHPNNEMHNFQTRLSCLNSLKEVGYQVGTGVMIGLPFQTTKDLANDLLFIRDNDIDMIGMGPYIEHEDTPLYKFKDQLLSQKERFDLTLKMIAILRIITKDTNIAAATALQAIDPIGREKAVKVGANIIMPNITPGMYRNDYALYQNKPCVDEEPEQCKGCLDARISLAEGEIGYGEWGDSKHYFNRKNKQ